MLSNTYDLIKGQFEAAIEAKAGKSARVEFEQFRDEVLAPGGLSEKSGYIPPFALRGDIGAIKSLSSYFFKFLSIGAKGTLFTGPFTKIMDQSGVS